MRMHENAWNPAFQNAQVDAVLDARVREALVVAAQDKGLLQ